MRNSIAGLCAAGILASAAVAWAGLPAPLDSTRYYAFPGAFAGAPSAVSTGRGLADRWLGEEPFDNPAAVTARGVMVAPQFLRVKRQDLLQEFEYKEGEGDMDLAGGRISVPVGGLGLALYGYQPVLRSEDATFVTRGDPSMIVNPRTFTTSSSRRDWRAGLAVSHEWRSVRLGAAGEWTQRDDAYDYTQLLPMQRQGHAEFSGGGFGFQVGTRVLVGSTAAIGAAVRYLPAMDLAGTGTTWDGDAQDISVTSEAGWEGGLSGCIGLSDAFRAYASGGLRTAQDLESFGLAAGRWIGLAAGLEYEAPEQPLTFRFGVGQEQQRSVGEPRAGYFSLGVGWKSETIRADLGGMRRSFSREGSSGTSYDDRVVASLTVGF